MKLQILFFVVAVLGITALAEVRVYEIKSVSLAGLYVETEEQAIFKRLGSFSIEDYFLYLYALPNNPTEWRIGYGRNKDHIKESFKASGEKNEPMD